MTKALCFLFLLGLLTFAQAGHFKKLSFQKGVTQGTRNLGTTPTEIFNVNLLPNHAISVDFGQTYRTVTASTDIPEMLILISSSDTVLAGFADEDSLGGFSIYNCIAPCTLDTQNKSTVTLPFGEYGSTLDEIGHHVQVSILDGQWNLSTPAKFLQSWMGDGSIIRPNKQYGWVGLGTNGSAVNNFPNGSPLFSVKFDDFVLGNGSLIFGNVSEYCNQTGYTTTLPSDSNWQVAVTSLVVNGTEYTNLTSVPLVFDLQYGDDDKQYISLPKAYYDLITTVLGGIDGVTCPEDAQCYYMAQDISALPTFAFKTGNDSWLTVDAALYTYDYEIPGFGYYFAFESRTESNIVLGWPYMRNYYTVFSNNGQNSTIQLYYNPATRIDPADYTQPADSGTTGGNTTGGDTTGGDTTGGDTTGGDTTGGDTTGGDTTGGGTTGGDTTGGDTTGGDTSGSNNSTNNATNNATEPGNSTDNSGSAGGDSTTNTDTKTSDGTTTPTATPSSGGHGVLITIIVLIVVILGALLYIKIRRAAAAAKNAAELGTQLQSNRSTDSINNIRL